MFFSDFSLTLLRSGKILLCWGVSAWAVLLSGVPAFSADLLDDLKARQAGVKTVRARFNQEKQTRLLARPLKSSGVFFFRQPDSIRWEYSGQVNMQVVYNGKELWIYYPDMREAERIRSMPQYTQLMHFDLSRMSREYDIQAREQKEMISLKFVPKTAGPLRQIDMEIPAGSSFPKSLVLTDARGELTKISFRDVVLNGEIGDSLFTFVPESGVKVRERSIP